MSTLPGMFRSLRPTSSRPYKQGGIYSLRGTFHRLEVCSNLQPEEMPSCKLQAINGQSRACTTSHTVRTRKVTASMEHTPYSSTVEQKRRGKSQLGFSRRSSREFRRDIFSSYGNSCRTFAIGEPQKASFEKAESLLHHANQTIHEIVVCQQVLTETAKISNDIRCQLKALKVRVECKHELIKQSFSGQVKKLKELLSQLRKETGMEIKVNKLECNQLKSSVKNLGELMGQIEAKSGELYELCLK